MKKTQLILIGGTVVLLMVCIFTLLSSPRHKATKLLSTELPRPVSVQWEDSHGGWFGEGVLYGRLTFSPDVGEALAQQIADSSTWYPLPLSQDLKIFLFGGEKDGVRYGPALSGGQELSAVAKGYYYVLDRKHSIERDSLLLGDNSTDVTVGVYDSQRSVLYVITYDS